MDRITDDWLAARETQAALNCLTRMGHQALVVGGCVRNALLGVPVADIDIATSALPETVTKLAENAGFKVVPTGIEHGTVTVVVDDVPFEVTTFRRDVETDGRHAEVAFSTSISDDARRRDFTMNAIYADADGQLLDPLDGLDDLRARRVRFIEDAKARIEEDYLRSLRYFRFYAWYGDHSEGPDAEALAAIGETLDGLDRLAAERIGAEMLKLLAAPEPSTALGAMHASGILAHILPGADPQFLAPLVHLEAMTYHAPDPIRRLAALGGVDVADRLRLSKVQARRLASMREVNASLSEMAYRHGTEAAWDIALLNAAMAGQPLAPDTAARIEKGALAVMPVNAGDLMPELEGKALGDRLKALEAAWINSEFALSKDALLALPLEEG